MFVYLLSVFDLLIFVQSEVRKTYNMLVEDEENDFEGFDLDPRCSFMYTSHVIPRFTLAYGVEYSLGRYSDFTATIIMKQNMVFDIITILLYLYRRDVTRTAQLGKFLNLCNHTLLKYTNLKIICDRI